VTSAELPYLHVFPYSERLGTPAARMPAVPMIVRRERAAQLRNAGRATLHRFMVRQVGQTISLLTETEHSGHSEHFASVRLAAPSRPGAVIRARVVGVTDDALLAEAA
jgi:threonylcarbamoyladenosine tRNA methylthiotransferase MtaB